MDDLKVRITLGDTTLEGTLDELPHHPCTAYGIRHFHAWPICSGKHVTIWPNDDTGTSWRVYVGGTLNTAKEVQSNVQNHT